MSTAVLIDGTIRIPSGIGTLAAFRRWSWSDHFPQRGRIDFIAGCIEVDMSPEDVWFHGVPKTEISATLHQIAKEGNLGQVLIDQTRVSNDGAGLSAEPDVVFITWQAFDEHRVRLIPKASGGEDRYIEIEGSPDLVIEILSDSSETKDLKRLPDLYFRAGIREYWFADARGKKLVFRIHRRGRGRFTAVKPDARGFQWSEVFAHAFKLDRWRDESQRWHYDLRVKNTKA